MVSGIYGSSLNRRLISPVLDVLHIRLHGGYYVDKGQIADLQFTCDHSAEEVCSQL